MKNYKIAASLTYGPLLSNGSLALSYGMLILCCSIAGVAIVMAVIDSDGAAFAVFASLVLLLCTIPFLILLIKDHKIRRKTKLWLPDAVFLTAIANEVGNINNGNVFILFIIPLFIPVKTSKLLVSFNYNGRSIQRYSGKSYPDDMVKNERAGYYRTFGQYANRDIPILYSPRYDQVLILKRRKEKT